MMVIYKIKKLFDGLIRNIEGKKVMVKEIDAVALSNLMKSDEVVLIDVREPEEYSSGHIDKAISIPLSVFQQKFQREDYPTDKKIVLQCQGGVRSMKACNIVRELAEQEHVINLIGGLNAWKNEGLPVVK
jgi:rhodanese-related sulfurtransferase